MCGVDACMHEKQQKKGEQKKPVEVEERNTNSHLMQTLLFVFCCCYVWSYLCARVTP